MRAMQVPRCWLFLLRVLFMSLNTVSKWEIRGCADSLPFRKSLCFGNLSFLRNKLLESLVKFVKPPTPSNKLQWYGWVVSALTLSVALFLDGVERSLIQSFGRAFGCHSCGVMSSYGEKTQDLKFIADHQPPNKFVKGVNIFFLMYLHTNCIFRNRAPTLRIFKIRISLCQLKFSCYCRILCCKNSGCSRTSNRAAILPSVRKVWPNFLLEFPNITDIHGRTISTVYFRCDCLDSNTYLECKLSSFMMCSRLWSHDLLSLWWQLVVA